MRTRAGASALLCMLAMLIAAPAAALADGHPRHITAATVNLRLGDRVLTIGERGTDVFHLQVLLTHRGFRVPYDGDFGPITRLAVVRAQAAYGLAQDGLVGPLTLAALRRGAPLGCSSAPGAGDYVTRWEPVVLCVLSMLHQPATATYANYILIIIRYESGGNPAAINLWDSNARRGDPSRGLMQVIGTTFERYRSPVLSSNIYDPAANIYAGVNYGISVYGSITGIPGVKAVIAGAPYRPYKLTAGNRWPAPGAPQGFR